MSITWLRLTIAGFVLASLAFTKEGHTSGGGAITITHDLVRVALTTGRKTVAREDAAAYAEQVARWEATNQPVAAKVVAAIERDVLRRYRAKLRLLPRRFDAADLVELSSEGFTRGDVPAGAALRLSVPLDLLPDGDVASVATFVLATRPRHADVRAFSQAVRTAALRAVGRRAPAEARYAAYWLVADAAPAMMLLTTVPLERLPAALAETSWRPMGFEAFRRAPALVLETAARRHLTRNTAGFLLANPTAARLDAAHSTIALQINGSFTPAMRVQRAPRVDALRLLASPIDPTLDRAAAAEARRAAADDIVFLDSLRPALAR